MLQYHLLDAPAVNGATGLAVFTAYEAYSRLVAHNEYMTLANRSTHAWVG